MATYHKSLTQTRCCRCRVVYMPTRPGQKYCSKQCNERAFHSRHSGYAAAANRKSRLKKPILCRWCGQPIPTARRKSGVVFCSDVCRRAQRLHNSRQHREKIFRLYAEYKCTRGCERCGYSACAAALDFHHVRGDKERRIDAGLWYSNSAIMQAELEKCVLLCKNCHYEVHNGFSLGKKIEENGDVA